MGIVKKLWGFSLRDLTMEGIADIIVDIHRVLCSLLFIFYYPTEFTDPAIQYVCAGILLVVIFYVFAPSLFQILLGRYQHYK